MVVTLEGLPTPMQQNPLVGDRDMRISSATVMSSKSSALLLQTRHNQ